MHTVFSYLEYSYCHKNCYCYIRNWYRHF